MTGQNSPTARKERELLERAINALDSRRLDLGDEVVDAALSSMRGRLAELEARERATQEPQQRKLVTVLFADVSGFTAMADSMDHEIVSSVINSLWSRVDRSVLDQGGRIDKHIGDAIMALFGTPTAREDDAERAVRSALQIQSEVREWKREQSESLPEYRAQVQGIQLRIGINTGPALLGTIGTLGEYTAIGDTVNLASRLEHAAPVGGILISHNTHRHVRGIFNTTALEPITVRGKSEPIQVYTVNGVRPRSFRDTTRGVEGVETRTIGREEELAQMKSAFSRMAENRQTHLVNLVAEAGTGKSRVLFEFGKWLDAQDPPVILFKGRATQETYQIPYSLLRGILSASFEIQENDPAATARQKLERGISRSTSDKENAVQYAHFIGHLIGLDYSTSPHLKGILGDARQIRDRAFHYSTQVIAEIAQRQPMVIFLEDIHWADSGSLDFFEYLMNTRPDLSLLVIGLMRAALFESRPDWGKGPHQSLTLNLLPLSDVDTRRLIAEILQKVPKIPEALIEMIVAKAEGSPFYVEELIRTLIEGGVVIRGEEQWSVEMDRLSSLKVPATLTGLLQSRLDGLKADVRETLQQASVVGRIFWTDIVENMRNPEFQNAESSVPVIDKLAVLRAKELVYRYEESGSRQALEFIFKNQILHDVTYESVLLRLRPIYHTQAAEGLIKVGGERADEYAGRVGEHYERAGERTKAAEWYARAGRKAQSTYASDLAINYYQKALAFLEQYGSAEHLRLKLEAYLSLGEVLNWQARYMDAAETYRAMLKFAGETDDPLAQSQALHGLATSLGYLGDNRAALESAIRAETLARSAGAKPELARALWAQGSSRYRLGESQAAMSLAEQASAIFEALDNQGEMARCLNLLGAAHYVSGRFDRAEEYWENALNIFQRLSNRQQGMDLLSNLGVIADARGDFGTAFQRYDSALSIAREIGYRDGEIVFLTNRGGAQTALGKHEAAEADLRQAIQMAGVTGSWCLPLTFNYRAEALIGLGRYEEAFYSARQALALGEEDKAPEYIGMAWRTLGMICDKIGDVVRFSDWETRKMTEFDAETCFARSVKVFVEAEIEMERARTLREWARYKFKQDQREPAEKLWLEAREIFAGLGAQMEVERMRDLPA